MNILVTGGAGYIGSHTILELLEENHEVTVVDNLVNSSRESLKRVQKLSDKTVKFHNFDLRDEQKLDKLFASNSYDAVIHFAGLKAVGESVKKPLEYYRNNLDSTFSLCQAMQKHGVKKLIFSSSATVYGEPESLPLTEHSQVGVGLTNPYGQTKFMIEQILKDLAFSDQTWEIIVLRYFNPVGAHKSGQIGEDPNGIPNNLFPFLSQVAVGKLEKLRIFGNDYKTRDGTCIRDYIHVVDLAKGHVAALNHIKPGWDVYNIATGTGSTVLEVVNGFMQATGKPVPYEIVERRPGDTEACYADCAKANQELGWKATKTITDACKDAWNWQSNNPNGYKPSTVEK